MKIKIGINEAGQRLDKFLRKYLKDVPLSAIYKALRKGDIRVNGSKGKENTFVELGDEIVIKYIYTDAPDIKKTIDLIEPEFKVTFEDKNILLVEKWPGILIHKDDEGEEETLTNQVLSYLVQKGEYNPEEELTFSPSPVNRLDRNTPGIVIYAKNYQALKALNEMTRDNNIKKDYLALVNGRIKDGTYKAFMDKREDINYTTIYNKESSGTKNIEMGVKTIESSGAYSFIELDLKTGRSHQLRAHLSHLGNPIVGDNKYGSKEDNSFFVNKYGLSYQYLYAYKITFKDAVHPLEYLNGKVISEKLPPVLRKIKNDLLKFDI